MTKDKLPAAGWKTAFWKDGIGYIDENMTGCAGFKSDLAQPHYAFP